MNAPGPATPPHTEPTTYIVALPAGYHLLSANDRPSRHARARHIRQIRADAILMARAAKLPRLQRAAITAVLHPRDRRHQDADNVQPTVKACVDGWVSVGLLPGDDERYVISTKYVLGEPVKGKQLAIHITDLGGAP